MRSSELSIPLEQTGAATMREYALILSRNRWVVLGAVALSLGLAWGYCLIATPYYLSRTLIVEDDRRGLDSTAQGSSSDDHFEQRLFLIQRQIINEQILGEVAAELGLYPADANEDTKSAIFYQLALLTKLERAKIDPAGGMTSSNLVDGFVLSFLHEDPKMAMKVTSRLAEKFIEFTNKEREKEVEGTGEFIDDELRWVKRELEKKEANISQFKKAHLGDLPQQADSNMRALDKVEAEISNSTESLQRHSDKLAMLNQAVQVYRTSGQQSIGTAPTRPVEPDPLFRRLKELREQLVKLRAEFWDGYPEVILTKEEIRRVEEELTNLYGRDAIRPDKAQLDPYLQDLARQQGEERTEIALLQRRLEQLHANKQELEKRLERSPLVEQELLVLERDYDSMKANHTKLLDKRMSTRVEENIEKRQRGAKYRVLDAATFPKVPAIPNTPRVLVVGFLFGCVLGGGLSILRERLTPQFRGPEDVEFLLSGPRLLAAIPDFSSLWHAINNPDPSQKLALPRLSLGIPLKSRSEVMLSNHPLAERSSLHDLDRRFVTKMFPRSMAAEQYRVAAARLQLLNATGGPVVAAVTSAIKGEGKTTTVINLGYTLSRDFGRRVLMVDCDFVYPEMAAFMEAPVQYGLIDCLKSDIPTEQAMSPFAEVPCWIMPAGKAVGNSTELLRAGQLDRVLSHLRDEFDYILINAPPILPVATMNVLESHCDLHLLVVRANVTSKQVVKQALGSLRADKPIHVVLNGVASNSLPSYMLDYSSAERSVAV